MQVKKFKIKLSRTAFKNKARFDAEKNNTKITVVASAQAAREDFFVPAAIIVSSILDKKEDRLMSFTHLIVKITQLVECLANSILGFERHCLASIA